MTDRCEPPPELRGVDGWHWVQRLPQDEPEAFHWMPSTQTWEMGEFDSIGYGYRYLSPVATPAEVAALRAERDRIVAEARDCARTLAAYTRDLEVISGHTHRAIAENATLRARVAELEGALDFYACVDHYPVYNAAAPGVVRDDAGAKARAALSPTPKPAHGKP